MRHRGYSDLHFSVTSFGMRLIGLIAVALKFGLKRVNKSLCVMSLSCRGVDDSAKSTKRQAGSQVSC